LGVLQILPQHESIHLAFRLTSAAFTENNLRRHWAAYLDVKGWSSNPIAIAVATTHLGLP